MSERHVAGIDWAGGQWLAVVFEGETFCETIIEGTFEKLWNEYEPNLDLALVDVPIGLPEDDSRLEEREAVDSLARSCTGRPSSVFPVPSREAAKLAYQEQDEDVYEEVAKRNEDEIDKGLSRQSYSIAAGIGEVDEFLQDGTASHDDIVESHPEVCFWAFRGQQLQHSKKSAAGMGERLDVLDEYVDDSGTLLREAITDLEDESGDVDVDDVLDAIVLGITAWEPFEDLQFLPEDPTTDEKEIPIRMAYYSDEPLPDQA